MKLIKTLILSLLAMLMASMPGLAASGDWDRNDHVAVRLISGVENAAGDGSLPFGLEFRLQPGWKIYWRTPGDAGYPPQVDWSGSGNVAKAELNWPVPERFSILGLETLGYKDVVVLPVMVTPGEAGQPVALKADINYLTCSDICIPYDASVSLSLDGAGGNGGQAEEAHLLNRFAARVPGAGTAGGLSVEEVRYEVTADGDFRIQVAALSDSAFDAPDVYVEGGEGLFFNRPEVSLQDDGRQATLDAVGGGIPVGEFVDAPLRITLLDGDRVLETEIMPQQGLREIQGSAAGGLWPVLLLALLGGLILNLMPCVLPVLSLKLLTVISHGGGDEGRVRIGFLASAAGILTAFMVLAAVLVGLQQAGAQVGWGIQFQQPLFLIPMLLLLVLFAGNLFGFFEFRLPGAVSDVAAGTGGQKGLSGHFLTGAFATLLATPCTAPFLGTAVGFALSQGGAVVFAIFAALGVGLAAPYLLVAAVPRLATMLPRPGAWMLKVKLVLGLALLATAGWLITVLDTILGRENAMILAVLSLLCLAVLWTRRLEGSRLGRNAFAGVAVLALASLAVPLARPIPQQQVEITDTRWIPFDEAAIPAYVAAGKTVFVDVTADWCITCKFNKKAVLDQGPVARYLADGQVIAMRADWTRPDPAIADYLARHGRYGIPFNIVYGPGRPNGVALPELLSTEGVLQAAVDAGAESRWASAE